MSWTPSFHHFNRAALNSWVERRIMRNLNMSNWEAGITWKDGLLTTVDLSCRRLPEVTHNEYLLFEKKDKDQPFKATNLTIVRKMPPGGKLPSATEEYICLGVDQGQRQLEIEQELIKLAVGYQVNNSTKVVVATHDVLGELKSQYEPILNSFLDTVKFANDCGITLQKVNITRSSSPPKFHHEEVQPVVVSDPVVETPLLEKEVSPSTPDGNENPSDIAPQLSVTEPLFEIPDSGSSKAEPTSTSPPDTSIGVIQPPRKKSVLVSLLWTLVCIAFGAALGGFYTKHLINDQPPRASLEETVATQQAQIAQLNRELQASEQTCKSKCELTIQQELGDKNKTIDLLESDKFPEVGMLSVAVLLEKKGHFSEKLQNANLVLVRESLKSFQTAIGVTPTGYLDEETWKRLR